MTEPTLREFRAAQKRRSIATAIALVAFIGLIFLVTVIKLQGHAINVPS
jgi:uncharacterized membrane protein